MSRSLKIVLALGVGLVGLSIVVAVTFIKLAESHEREQEQQQQKMATQQRAEQEAFEKTPEGKKAKAARLKEAARVEAARLKEKNEAEAMDAARALLAESIEKQLLQAGFDVKTGTTETKLYITGEQVNGVFAYNLMAQHALVKSMRDAGFKTVTFWNGHQFTGIFTQDYDLTKHP